MPFVFAFVFVPPLSFPCSRGPSILSIATLIGSVPLRAIPYAASSALFHRERPLDNEHRRRRVARVTRDLHNCSSTSLRRAASLSLCSSYRVGSEIAHRTYTSNVYLQQRSLLSTGRDLKSGNHVDVRVPSRRYHSLPRRFIYVLLIIEILASRATRALLLMNGSAGVIAYRNGAFIGVRAKVARFAECNSCRVRRRLLS